MALAARHTSPAVVLDRPAVGARRGLGRAGDKTGRGGGDEEGRGAEGGGEGGRERGQGARVGGLVGLGGEGGDAGRGQRPRRQRRRRPLQQRVAALRRADDS